MGSAKAIGGIFAKTCFETAVGVWSARRGEKTRFLIAFFGFSDSELIAHNRSLVGSSPATRANTGGHLYFRIWQKCKLAALATLASAFNPTINAPKSNAFGGAL
jgi:hypothetical protein